jgi:hypothetical protein
MMATDHRIEKKFIIAKNLLINKKCWGDDERAIHRAKRDQHCYQKLDMI